MVTPSSTRTMTNASTGNRDVGQSLLCAVMDGGEIALVRAIGRGTFANSMALKRFATHVRQRSPNLKFILDLKSCDSMDSTFMGVIAGIAIGHLQNKMPKVIVVNANDHCKKLLKNLGLAQLLDIRSGTIAEADRAEGRLAPAAEDSTSRLDQIVLTLEAHKDLVKVDEENEVRFQAVIEYLEKSLETEGEETGSA